MSGDALLTAILEAPEETEQKAWICSRYVKALAKWLSDAGEEGTANYVLGCFRFKYPDMFPDLPPTA